MIQVHLRETGSETVLLTGEQAVRLAGSGIVDARPAGGGRWTLSANRKVGVARVGDVELWIQPKVPIARLFFLLGYATGKTDWRDEPARVAIHTDLLPAVAEALARQAERATRVGLLYGYRVREESAYVLRGRLREADQLRRHYGLPLPMEIRYDEHTADIAENRLLLGAITRLLRVPGLRLPTRTTLSRLRLRLAEVSEPPRGPHPPAWTSNRLNARYHLALRLAEIVWRATTPDHDPGAVPATGFLVDLDRVFEDFVTTAITEALRGYGGQSVTQFPCRLDEADRLAMRPDLVWTLGGRPAGVLDAKYKTGRPVEDLYQLLAYCTALGLPRGHLVYAAGETEAIRHVVRNAGVEIVVHALDLARAPDDLLDQIAAIAGELTAERMVA